MSRLLRKVLLWCARNTWLASRLSRLPFMQRAVRRFLPGDEASDALGVAVDLHVVGIDTLYARLATPISGASEAKEAADHYLDLLDRIKAADIDGEVSVTARQLGLDVDEDLCFGHLRVLAAAAEARGTWLWIDMEGSASVDRTLDLYQRLRASCQSTGISLQACLRRTAKDVERLLPMSPAIRLVKGVFDEPTSIAFQSKKEIDANFLGLAVTMLRESRNRPAMRVALGTHDVQLIAQIAMHAAAAGVAKDAFEIQVRYGVRPREMRRLARAGYRVRTLITYGSDWYHWYMLRLAERPENVLLALRELLPR